MTVTRTNKERVLRRVRGFATDGTLDIMIGSLVAGLTAYAYQILAGRALGEVDFAPVSALLTLHFLAFAVVLLPVEQLVIRRLSLDRADTRVPAIAVFTVLLTAFVAAVFAFATRNRLFAEDPTYAALAAATVLTHGVFAVVRGHMAGQGRYRAYASISAGAGVVRLVLAVGVVAVSTSAVGISWTLALGALIAFFVPGRRGAAGASSDDAGAGRILTGLVLASAASQALLLAGPLVAGGLSEDPVVVSVVFATFTLFRAPLVFGYNLIARVLPPFTAMVAEGRIGRLLQWAYRFALVGAVGSVGGVVGGAILGPPVIGIAFGAEFRPEPIPAGLVAAGVVLAAAGLFVGQILVARGDTALLAAAWVGAVAAAGLALLLPAEDPELRVALAFLVGEIGALSLLLAGVMMHGRPGQRRSRPLYRLAKRSFDVGVAAVGLVVAAPVAAVAAVAVRRDSPGPALFRQERVGRDGRVFRMWKFRTMEDGVDDEVLLAHLQRLAAAQEAGNAEELRLRVDDDPRVTRVGRRLRSWSLDELPNLWNVLRGDMSLVGPRPLVPAEVALMGPDSTRRSEVRPGVTGWAQIQGRDEIDMAERTRYDLEYLEIRSFWLDLRILARTALAVFRQPGA